MERRFPMKTVFGGLIAAGLALGLVAADITAQTATPYKLGMFEQNGRVFVGLVIQNDTLVIDLSRANVGAPATLKQLIAGWDAKMAGQLAALAAKPSGTIPVAQLKHLPPIPDPRVLLSTAVNYTEHALEMTGNSNTAASAAAVDPKVAQGIPGYWQRRAGDPRHNPYFFVKANSAITGHNDPIVLPRGRERIDWECEMNIVIGRTAKRVTRDNAADYIFGYTLMNDVSDRGGRPDGRHGSDWQLGKSHDTFAPLGPYVVPRQFVANPQRLAIKFTLTRQGDAGLQYRSHDTHGVRSGRIRVAHDDAASRRSDLDRQPGRRWHGARDADLFQGRRHLDVHHRVDRHAVQSGEGG